VPLKTVQEKGTRQKNQGTSTLAGRQKKKKFGKERGEGIPTGVGKIPMEKKDKTVPMKGKMGKPFGGGEKTENSLMQTKR